MYKFWQLFKYDRKKWTEKAMSNQPNFCVVFWTFTSKNERKSFLFWIPPTCTNFSHGDHNQINISWKIMRNFQVIVLISAAHNTRLHFYSLHFIICNFGRESQGCIQHWLDERSVSMVTFIGIIFCVHNISQCLILF